MISNLFPLFLGLKLGGIIDWSWWFVAMPVYVPALIAAMLPNGVADDLKRRAAKYVKVVR